MIFKPLPLTGAYAINLEKKEDHRGFFARSFCLEELAKQGLEMKIAQINNSMSKYKGTLRGLHFQYPPKAEIKIIRCIRGSIWDVIVDIRKDSPTYGRWYGIELNESNRSLLYVPKGFAHGFLSLTDDAEIIYLVSETYSPAHEGTLRWDDPFHKIQWPIQPHEISQKDTDAPNWQDDFSVK